MRIPQYRVHSTRDIGFVEFQRHRHYLPGRANSEESREAYKAFIREHVLKEKGSRERPGGRLGISELIERFLDYSEGYYGDGNSEHNNMRAAVLPLLDIFPAIVAADFRPLKLKAYQKYLAQQDNTRNYVNGQIRRVKQMFKWAVSEELLPPSVFHALETVPGLKKGKTEARESEPRQPAAWEQVEAVLPSMPPTLRGMVELQWHCGVRSQNIVSIRPCDVDVNQTPALWKPPKHKTVNQGKELLVFLGPQAMKVLAAFLDRSPESFCFDPREAMASLYEERAAKRVCKRYPHETRKGPSRRLRDRYTSSSYRNAIVYAIGRCNKDRAEIKLPPVEHWTPHQLRHSKATAIREKYGLEEAQAALGWSTLDATQIYAHKNLDLARRIAMEVG